MDWPNLVAYIVILLNVGLLSYRFGDVQVRLRQLDAKVSFLFFVHTQLLEGKDPEQIQRAILAMGREAQEAMEFAEIARRERRPWWRRLASR